jgi:two-component system response regulator
MNQNSRAITILIADSDGDDRRLIEAAFRENGQGYALKFVQDGIELLQYLQQQGRSSGAVSSQRPALILLDLNLPRKDGRLALAEIKADLDLRCIPVVVLTSSSCEEDILYTYQLGGAGYIIKPTNIADMIEVVKVLNQYWFEVVELSLGEHEKNVRSNHPSR